MKNEKLAIFISVAFILLVATGVYATGMLDNADSSEKKIAEEESSAEAAEWATVKEFEKLMEELDDKGISVQDVSDDTAIEVLDLPLLGYTETQKRILYLDSLDDNEKIMLALTYEEYKIKAKMSLRCINEFMDCYMTGLANDDSFTLADLNKVFVEDLIDFGYGKAKDGYTQYDAWICYFVLSEIHRTLMDQYASEDAAIIL